MSVSNIERETVILFNEAEDSLGSVTYSVAKDRLSISLRAPLSEEKKEALRERGKKLFERLKEKQSSEER